MTTLRPYPEYRSSGIEWLGDVPIHWDVTKLKNAGSLILGGATPKSDYEGFWGGKIVWVTPEDISKTDFVRSSRRKITDAGLQSCAAKLAPVGSIVLTCRAPIGNTAIAGVELAANQGGKVIIPNESQTLTRYLFATLSIAKNELQSLGTGTTFAEISTSDVSGFSIAVPPLPEQQAIAEFLDVADACISRYIAAKRRMIALLEEQKQAIINQAVTRGLDPDVPLKPSGVDWLGDIPAHWAMRKVGSLANLIQTGPFGSQLPASDYILNGVPLINPSHISKGEIIPASDITVSEQTADRLARHRFQEGDLVLARRGEMGRCAVVNSLEVGWLCGTGSLLIRPIKSRIQSHYLQLILSNHSLAAWLVLTSAGATMSNLNTTMVSQINIPVPSIEEQMAIVSRVMKQNIYHSSLIRRAHSEIELIQEYRTRLISDVVTGKLDVRGVELPALDDIAGTEGDSVIAETEPVDEWEEVGSDA